MDRIVGIHQPNFLPWLGYFRKISLCDTFIFLESVQLNKKGYTRRVKIREEDSKGGTKWLTIPLNDAPSDYLISQLSINQSRDWNKKHLNKIKHAYHDAPYYNETISWIAELYESVKKEDSLSKVNQFFINELCKTLDISTELISFQNQMKSDVKGELNYLIAKEFKASHYLRGAGEQKYNEFKGWQADESIEILDLEMDHWKAEMDLQLPKHLLGTSIIDAFMWAGKEQIKNSLKIK